MAFARWPRPILAEPGARGWTEGLAGERIRVRVHSDQVMGRFSQIEALVEPGQDLLRVRHRYMDLVIHVMQGRLQLSYDNREFEGGPGTVVALPRDTVHGWRPSGDTPLMLMLTYSPGGIEALIRACHGLKGSDLESIARTFGTDILEPPEE
ncbi:MAG: cupin domain-containing protein [Sphingopyxis sp.]|nr:cupin domain-containing protein [Sphingopyxis sp.]